MIIAVIFVITIPTLVIAQSVTKRTKEVSKKEYLKIGNAPIVSPVRSEKVELSTQTEKVAYIAPEQPTEQITTTPTTENVDPKLFIYFHESGNDPTRWNGSGCLGLGQACPASKLLAVCPNMDYACEDAWFTEYAVNRYGSWQGAYNFWLQNNWW